MRPGWKRLALGALVLTFFAFAAVGAEAQDYGLRKVEIEIEGMT